MLDAKTIETFDNFFNLVVPNNSKNKDDQESKEYTLLFIDLDVPRTYSNQRRNFDKI